MFEKHHSEPMTIFKPFGMLRNKCFTLLTLLTELSTWFSLRLSASIGWSWAATTAIKTEISRNTVCGEEHHDSLRSCVLIRMHRKSIGKIMAFQNCFNKGPMVSHLIGITLALTFFVLFVTIIIECLSLCRKKPALQ